MVDTRVNEKLVGFLLIAFVLSTPSIWLISKFVFKGELFYAGADLFSIKVSFVGSMVAAGYLVISFLKQRNSLYFLLCALFLLINVAGFMIGNVRVT